MPIALSKLTAQGQVSVPAAVRQKLGVAPGSVIEWDEQAGNIVVRRAASTTFEDIHNFLVPPGTPRPAPLTVEQMDEAIGEAIRKKHGTRR